MKILSYEIDGNRLKILTDNPGRKTFVYQADKFSSADEVKIEIENSVFREFERKEVAIDKRSKLKESLDKFIEDDIDLIPTKKVDPKPEPEEPAE